VSDPVLVYDGDCGFCTSSVRLLQKWVTGRYHVVPWQDADLEGLGLDAATCGRAVQWVASPGARREGAAAFSAVLQVDPRWRALGKVLDLFPLSLLAAAAYELIARNRYRLPGGTPACKMPAGQRPG
jgi:predicted DCC family thiol-disulfide oxidoreductase YuxK